MKRLKMLVLASLLSASFAFPAMAAGWSAEGEEKIWLKDDGSRAVNEWIQDQGNWYFFEDHGWMVTGWWPVDGKWYYLRGTEENNGAAVRDQWYMGYYFDASGAYSPAIPTVQNPGDGGHNYYKNLPEWAAKEADLRAELIASQILNNPDYKTDLEKVDAAAKAVQHYMAVQGDCPVIGDYDYRSPYGIFCSGCWTCAGVTRGLGRVLDFMGYSWTHFNENQDHHQRCLLTLDGQEGHADGQAGYAGYGPGWSLFD